MIVVSVVFACPSQRAFCTYCADRIWGLGRQGFKCLNCKLMVHKKCHKLFKHTCTGHQADHSSDSTPSTPGQHDSNRTSNGDSDLVHGLHRIATPARRKHQMINLANNDLLPSSVIESENTVSHGQDVDDASNELLSGSDSQQYSLKDFELLRVIGRGSYAKVLMVELKKTKCIYAMKVIKKELVTDDEDIDWVQTEKHVFETASNYPFLVGLHSCFQTASRCVRRREGNSLF